MCQRDRDWLLQQHAECFRADWIQYCLLIYIFSPICRKIFRVLTGGVPGCSKDSLVKAKCHHRAAGVTLCHSVHPHHHHRPARVSSVAAALVLAVVGGVAPVSQAAGNENDLHHVRPKVGDAAQTPKIGSAGRQNCSLGRQCSHW